MGVPKSSILSPVFFFFFSSLKINILKSVLKGSEASLFVDDFALCLRAKFLPHAQRLMQLCVNSVQDWVCNNGFKFSTSKTVCMHFCNQRKHFAEPSILSTYSSHVSYLKTNFLKALDIFEVVGHQLGGRSENLTLSISSPRKI